MADAPRTQRLPPAVRRAQLLDAALEVVGRDGMPALSVEAVAREANVTRPTVYDHFGDLDGLLLALLDREEATALAPLAWIAAGADGRDPDAFLVDGLRSFLEAVAAAPQTWRLILLPADGGSPALRERVQKRREELVAHFEALLHWGTVARGGPAGFDGALFAPVIIAFGEELARLVLTHPRRYPPARLTYAVAGLIDLLPREGTIVVPREDQVPDDRVVAAPEPEKTGEPPNTGRARVPMAERRRQLLDVALALVGADGFDALTVDAVARRAKVNRVIVYRAYANLSVLRLALMRREGARIDRQLDAFLPSEGDTRPPPQLLLETLAAFLEAVSERPATWRLAMLKPESAPTALQRLVYRRRSQVAERLTPLVASGIQGLDNDVEGIDVEVLARLLLCAAEELARATLADPTQGARILLSFAGLLDALRWREP